MSNATVKRAVVTGANGFTGRFLCHLLAEHGIEVHAFVHQSSGSVTGSNDIVADLSDEAALGQLFDRIRPHYVFHLAAISFVPHADASAFYDVNTVYTQRLLSALQHHQDTLEKVVIASSANVYGDPKTACVTIDHPIAPINHYGCSKVSMEFMARTYQDRLPIIITRPFNYTGLGQADHFLVPKIISHAVERKPFIELGNTDIVRDFSDVRDVVLAYLRLAQSPHSGATVNIASGTAYALKEVLALIERITSHRLEVRINPAFVRKQDIIRLVGDPGPLEAMIGSYRQFGLEDTLTWMVNKA